MTQLERFTNAFREERERTGLSLAEIARKTGIGISSIGRYQQGKSQPSPTKASLLADVFQSDLITRVCRATRNCDVCNKEYTYDITYQRKYCSDRCRNYIAVNNRQKNEFKRRGMELEIHHKAINAFCRDCVGSENICRDAECPLRPISPIPLKEGLGNAKSRTVYLPVRTANRAFGSGGYNLISE